LAGVVVALLLLNARLSRQRERAESAQASALVSKGESERAASELGQLVRRQYQNQGRQLILAGDPLHGLAYLAAARERGARGPALDFLIADALRATEGELFQVRQDDALARARFSPDGTTLVTCGFDGEARLWEAATGRPRARLRHAGAVRRIDVSRDGRFILTASSDGTAGLWEAASGRRLRTFGGGGGPVQAALFAPDGSRVVTVGADDAVRSWNPADGKLVRLLARPDQIAGRLIGTPVAFAPDGSLLAAGTERGRLRIWQMPAGRLVAEVPAHGGRITSIAFSRAGDRLVTASLDGTASIWRSDGRKIAALGHRGQVFDAGFSPDGRRIVTASADRSAVVWDAERGTALFSLASHPAGVNAALFSPDGSLIATVSDDAIAQLWDGASGRRLGRRLGHRASINSAAFDPSGARLVTAGVDGVAIVWTTQPEHRVRRLGPDGGGNAWAEFSARGDRVAAAGSDGRLRVWDAASGRSLQVIDAHRGAAHAARFSRDDRLIASAGDDGTVKVWDAAAGALRAELTGHRGPVNHVAWSPDGARLLSAGSDGEVHIWSTTEKRSLATLAVGKPVFAAEFTSAADRVVTASGQTEVWDPATGRRLAIWSGDDARYTLELDGAGRALSCSSLQAAKLIDLASGKPLAEMVGHAGDVASCRFARDGNLVATGSLDGTARIWDPATGDLLSVITAGGLEVMSVGFSPDGGRLVVGGDDGVSLWDLPRLPDDFERRIRCRVPYQVAGDRLAPRELDADGCRPR
ncbi:MAG TPA: WD40 repeat domain-containing protein, partial [Kofleriaceae bacterium]|nr:WD40 repeat domain-containing protein [Kofleriaceae bacterium]